MKIYNKLMWLYVINTDVINIVELKGRVIFSNDAGYLKFFVSCLSQTNRFLNWFHWFHKGKTLTYMIAGNVPITKNLFP